MPQNSTIAASGSRGSREQEEVVEGKPDQPREVQCKGFMITESDAFKIKRKMDFHHFIMKSQTQDQIPQPWAFLHISQDDDTLFHSIACMNFEHLLFCRLLLGACLSSITSGLMSVTSRLLVCNERHTFTKHFNGPRWFDREQAVEAICDVKTWIWFVYMILVNIPNITCHQALLFSFFEYSARNTTALSCTFSLMHIINIYIAMYLLRCFSGARAYVGIFMQIPNVIGTVLAIMAPENSKGTLIASIYLTWFSPIAYIIALDLIISNTNGHTS
ncbi:uncharacterized protein MELLADRAFT_63109 [Melampsora larici-populina 98AG31]|uniref:Uncharacterized protein n=1 Tax=Melampsora larici-populina (strain 98AG31 / pathotype 3-4-7) TaxID=747676 RepID=F4RLC1_MELLP|nr:uncharacterized protein MELLADRAFT_63109 [Melampsora larici-populina 98AG31]EGG06897.1 hypothetical protein MELLADRAFT_63109 [Melampsora larici-populina 98AG31]